MQSIEVGAGEYHVARPTTQLTCLGLGSCVGLALWDRSVAVGGLAHIVLPDSRRYSWQERPGMFADRAPVALLAALRQLGGRRATIVAKVVGGASLFGSSGDDQAPLLQIGRCNLEAVRRALRHLGLPLVGEDVGGTHGRTVEFCVVDGRLHVRSLHGIVHVL